MTEKNPVAKPHTSRRKPLILVLIALLLIIGICCGAVYLKVSQSRVYIEQAQIDAPIISLSPEKPGVLENIFVNEGDKVREDMIVAMVGGNSIRAKTDGIVLSIKNTPGQIVSSQDAVVKMLNPQEFRLVGRIAEDKGLKDIREGQTVLFTVDAFGTKEYRGVIDSISPTSRQSDIVFSISDKREEKQFDVKAKYDVDAYPELKNGMSAKMWVYIK